MIASKSWSLNSLDIKSAFLQGQEIDFGKVLGIFILGVTVKQRVSCIGYGPAPGAAPLEG